MTVPTITFDIDDDGHLTIHQPGPTTVLVKIRWRGLQVDREASPGHVTETGLRIRELMVSDDRLVHLSPETVASWDAELSMLRRQAERSE